MDGGYAMEKGRLTALFKPDGVYTRHSEGAFLRMKDGALMFAYSRFTGAWFDDAPSARNAPHQLHPSPMTRLSNRRSHACG